MKFALYILSIEHCDRRCHVVDLSKRLLQLGFDSVKIVDAIYWKESDVFPILDSLQIEYKNTGVSTGQIACFLTHYKAWYEISHADPETIHIIIEDDMDISQDFSMIDFSKAYESIDGNFDSIFLYKHPEQANCELPKLNEYFFKHYFQWGTCAYSIMSDFAGVLCNKMKSIDAHVDNQLQTFFETTCKDKILYSVKDFLDS